jgi:hypothetical protein
MVGGLAALSLNPGRSVSTCDFTVDDVDPHQSVLGASK